MFYPYYIHYPDPLPKSLAPTCTTITFPTDHTWHPYYRFLPISLFVSYSLPIHIIRPMFTYPPFHYPHTSLPSQLIAFQRHCVKKILVTQTKTQNMLMTNKKNKSQKLFFYDKNFCYKKVLIKMI